MMNITGVLSMTIIPNWIHHSKKDQGRTLKPQALRSSKQRLKALKYKLNVHNHRARGKQ